MAKYEIIPSLKLFPLSFPSPFKTVRNLVIHSCAALTRWEGFGYEPLHFDIQSTGLKSHCVNMQSIPVVHSPTSQVVPSKARIISYFATFADNLPLHFDIQSTGPKAHCVNMRSIPVDRSPTSRVVRSKARIISYFAIFADNLPLPVSLLTSLTPPPYIGEWR